ncbi:MAG: hypothetical protein J4400_00010 [Candidatus Aenigmarchaeota archaeon]|nr:hypothetical protein [Candidatus Aenigmarchaeota archaeon]
MAAVGGDGPASGGLAIQTNEQAAVNQGVETVYTEMENAPESSSGAATVGNNRERGVES